MPLVANNSETPSLPIWALTKDRLAAWAEENLGDMQAWLQNAGFGGDAGEVLPLPNPDGSLRGVVLGMGDAPDMWAFGDLSKDLPPGIFHLDTDTGLGGVSADQAALAFGLGAYQFTRYRSAKEFTAFLKMPTDGPNGADPKEVERLMAGVILARDLVNTPAEDMGPAVLAATATALASRFDASIRTVVGEELLQQNYPAIHAVGRAASHGTGDQDRAPRLIDMTWGNPDDPKVTLVGKGVCFDTGGLDIKSAAGMLKMKKDMGGAATALGLATMLMDANLPIRLRVLISAVENAISGNAYRPGDVLKTRKGLTVEIGNTDAEGRIVLSDALTDASAEKPEILIDFATLTGAARVALGTDLPALFCNNDDAANAWLTAGVAENDQMWRMPLHAPYKPLLMSRIADLNNISEGGFGGAVTAALFLEHFVDPAVAWSHIDLYAWNDKPRPGRPAGGEAMTARALYRAIKDRFGEGAASG